MIEKLHSEKNELESKLNEELKHKTATNGQNGSSNGEHNGNHDHHHHKNGSETNGNVNGTVNLNGKHGNGEIEKRLELLEQVNYLNLLKLRVFHRIE